ncbi:MAG: hypothetical protein ACQERB_15360 [Promethearchaeati archaeon]
MILVKSGIDDPMASPLTICRCGCAPHPSQSTYEISQDYGGHCQCTCSEWDQSSPGDSAMNYEP